MTQLTLNLSRRRLMTSAAAAGGLMTAPSILTAGAPMLGVAQPAFTRFKLGEFEVTTLLAGTRVVEEPQTIFGMNVTAEEFAAASAEADIPIDSSRFFFTPTVVNTGDALVLFDTGLSAEGTTAALAEAGYTPDQIDTVVITHMHGDHIGGLSSDAGVTYPNATYMTGAAEFDAWAGADNENFEAKVRPLAEKMTMLDDGGSVTSGITAMAAFGHTPGHMVYMIESGGRQLVIAGDFANHYVWSLAHPDWEVRFDMDKEAAAATRRRLLDMMATDGLPFIGYHMPFPALGYVETAGSGFRYVPHSYQLTL